MNKKGLNLRLYIGYSLAKIKSPFDLLIESKTSNNKG